MVLSAFGRPTKVRECRAAVPGGRDGVSAAALMDAAETFGLSVEAYRAEPRDLFALPAPSVLHWRFNHFVVLERACADHVVIVDPAIGRQRVSWPEVDRSFTGVLVTFSVPDGWVPPPPPDRPQFFPIAGAIAGTPGARHGLALVLFSSVLLQALGLAVPLATKIVVDGVLVDGGVRMLWVLALASTLFVAGEAALQGFRALVSLRLRVALDQRLVAGFMEHLMSLPYAFFAGRSSGDLLMRLGSNAQLREIFTDRVVNAMLDASMIVGYGCVLGFLDWQYATLTLVAIAAHVTLTVSAARHLRELSDAVVAARAEQQGFAIDLIRGAAEVKASGAEPTAVSGWRASLERELEAALASGRFGAAIGSASTALSRAVPVGFLLFGAYRVLDGDMSLGTMLAVNAVAVAVIRPAISLTSLGQRLLAIWAHLDRVLDVLSEPPESTGGGLLCPEGPVQIEVRRIGFRYGPESPWVVGELSVLVPAGETVAIVGPSGSGKSSLLKLMTGLLVPERGEIFVHGRLREAWDQESLRRLTRVVFQEPILFAGTIRENMRVGSDPLTEEQIWRALHTAALAEEVYAMPQRLETRLSEGGGGLSGGQRQRLSIARALAARPGLLVLDEATSHLDTRTESVIQERLAEQRVTQIVVAHRLSTIRGANRIVYMEGGRMVETGSHEELMCLGGGYAAAVQSQTGW